MNYKNKLIHLNDVFNNKGLLEDVYEACRTMDMAGAAISALTILRNTNTLLEVKNIKKSKDLSSSFRIRGNSFYKSQESLKVQRAFGCYNKALLCAPKDSIELVLAYSNRSALLFKLKAYNACLKDIETCFKLQCTEDLLKKLTSRKKECQKMMMKNNIEKLGLRNSFTQNFFKVKGKSHPEIPCLSADVDMVSESGEIKAVAAEDILVGTVLAVETSFTTYSEQDKINYTCYNCQKMTLNLFPCDNCCYALFCSSKCQELCLNEYHLIECQIMDLLRTVDTGGGRFRLAIKTALKIKTLCKQWSTLIKEADNMGADRLKTSSLNEIYDVKNYSSILSFNNDRHFIHGILYNSCFVHALIIHYLEKISGFFPTEQKDCLDAQKCFAKLLAMIELMWPCATEIDNVGEELGTSGMALDLACHYGIFAFTSKLKSSCEPNVLVFGLDDQVGLVAIRPIIKKSELKISYVGHWAQRLYNSNYRMMKMYRNTFNICTCRVCKEGWNAKYLIKSDFNNDQKSIYTSWIKLKESLKLPHLDASFFKETCYTLTALDDQVRTTEYHTAFSDFSIQLSMCQIAVTDNYKINI